VPLPGYTYDTLKVMFSNCECDYICASKCHKDQICRYQMSVFFQDVNVPKIAPIPVGAPPTL